MLRPSRARFSRADGERRYLEKLALKREAAGSSADLVKGDAAQAPPSPQQQQQQRQSPWSSLVDSEGCRGVALRINLDSLIELSAGPRR